MHCKLAACAVLLLTLLAAAAQATDTQHALIDFSSIVGGVSAARIEVEAALADPAAAFEQYLQKFAAVAAPHGHTLPGGPQDSRSKGERLQTFTANLQKVAARNAASSSKVIAFGITPFMHLTQAEFELHYLGQTEASKAAAEAEPAYEVFWSAESDAAAAAEVGISRKLLDRQQSPAAQRPSHGSPSTPTQSPAQTARVAGLTTSSSSSGSMGGRIKDGTLELTEAPAPARAVAPAQHLPRQQRHEAAGPITGLPTLPYNPEPGAGGCVAQRSYPYGDVVPPADGVNWVTAGGTTPIKDQGQCGSCVAFATVALAEFMHMRKYGTTNTTTDLSEQDLLDCTIGDGCQGQFQQAYANLIGCGGIALEADGPYRAADRGQDLCRPARRYSGMAHGAGGGWASVRSDSDTLAQAISQAPVMITLDATDWALYAGGVMDCDTPGKGVNHAVVIVGYINRVKQPNGEEWDLFLIRNSFGGWWGSGNGAYAGHVFVRKGCKLVEQTAAGPSGLHALEGVLPLFG